MIDLYLIPEEDYLAHYGRKGMKWYQHIFGEEASRARSEKRAQRTQARYEKKGQKIAKLKSRSDKYLQRAAKNKIFFSTFRESRAVNKCAKALRKISKKGYRMTKNEIGRNVLNQVLKSDGGYKYIDYLRNKRIYEKVYRKI